MKEPWYKEGLQFECTACGKCCSGGPGYVWITTEDVTALAKAIRVSEEQFRNQYIRKVGAAISLKEYPNGDCILLDPETRHCLAYRARPVQCRTWPFWTSNLKTEKDWEETCEVCPGAGKGKLYTLDQIEIERTKKERL